MDASVKVVVSGRVLAEAVRDYLEARMAPGCRVRRVWLLPPEEGDEPGEPVLQAEVELSGGHGVAPPRPAPTVPEAGPAPEVDDGPVVLEEPEALEDEHEAWTPPAQDRQPATPSPVATVPGARARGDVVREAPSLEVEELGTLQEVDPVAAKMARRARAHRRLLLGRGERHG